ncbi:MAG TPA: TrkA family potassium uptake protein [Actinobacteria bacterium]|nr:TrkA family potassium uptake protein [Actinomycetota bacterium]
MYVVIVGAGRVGSALALGLIEDGHEVCFVDEDEGVLDRLGEDYPAEFVHGVGIDIGALDRAGTGRADAFVAATDGDNTNIVSAQLARDRFGVKCVISRVYDPKRARFFREALGIRTICPTQETIDRLAEAVRKCEVDL